MDYKIVKTAKGWGILKPCGRYVDDWEKFTKEQAKARLKLIEAFRK